jgi:hypothetical protein
MKMPHMLCRLGIVTGLATLPFLTFAAETSNKSETPPPLPSALPTITEVEVDLDIVQGKMSPEGKEMEATLENIAQLWRNRLGINVALSPGAAKIRIDDLKLRSATLNEALQALTVAGNSQFVFQVKKPEPGVDPTTGEVKNEAGRSLVLFQARSQPKQSVEVFNLTPYFRFASITTPDQINEALQHILMTSEETVDDLRISNQDAPDYYTMPRIKFHKGSNLLVVTGTSEAINVVQKIVNALNQAPPEERVRH